MHKKMRLVLVVVCIYFRAFAANAQKSEEKEAVDFGRSQAAQMLEMIKTFNLENFISVHDGEKNFNEDEALENLNKTLKKEPAENTLNKTRRPPVIIDIVEDLKPQDLQNFQISLDGLVKEDPAPSKGVFSSIVTKLSIFNEIKQDLEKTQAPNANQAHIFNGECRECSKSVLGKALYDCCVAMKGLATKAHLAKCSSEELALAALRGEGKCHHVGEYKKRIISGISKEKNQVFCCFSSKLARVLQEQGRIQLHRGWKDPKKPDCGGLTMEEIQQLDFTKIDLDEIAQETLRGNHDFEGKLKSFQKRIQESQIKELKD